jgi:hypothetical protein
MQPDPEPVVLPTLGRDQIQGGPIQQEEPLQLGSGEITNEPLIHDRLIIRQELNRHSRRTYMSSPQRPRPPNRPFPSIPVPIFLNPELLGVAVR